MSWPIDPNVTYLNHGSFGSCPTPVLEEQTRIRERMEKNLMKFYVRDYEELLDSARADLGRFVGANPERLAFVHNATAGVNAVLRSLPLKVGDEVLTTNHSYNACRNALDAVAEAANARVICAEIPFPLNSADWVVERILEKVTPRTRLALIDHVTSPTGLIFPIETLIQELSGRGIETLIDGAHAPGMVPLDIEKLGATYYTGNCHKWICAPKGAGFLWVHPDKLNSIHPVIVSHGRNSTRTDRSRFHLEFDWTGTNDPSAFLSIPAAIRFMSSLLPSGWPELREKNRTLALAARKILCNSLEIETPASEEMIGSLASVPIPDSANSARTPLEIDPLQMELADRFSIEVPIFSWPQKPRRLLRISAQAYNHLKQYEYLADSLRQFLRKT